MGKLIRKSFILLALGGLYSLAPGPERVRADPWDNGQCELINQGGHCMCKKAYDEPNCNQLQQNCGSVGPCNPE